MTRAWSPVDQLFAGLPRDAERIVIACASGPVDHAEERAVLAEARIAAAAIGANRTRRAIAIGLTAGLGFVRPSRAGLIHLAVDVNQADIGGSDRLTAARATFAGSSEAADIPACTAVVEVRLQIEAHATTAGFANGAGGPVTADAGTLDARLRSPVTRAGRAGTTMVERRRLDASRLAEQGAIRADATIPPVSRRGASSVAQVRAALTVGQTSTRERATGAPNQRLRRLGGHHGPAERERDRPAYHRTPAPRPGHQPGQRIETPCIHCANPFCAALAYATSSDRHSLLSSVSHDWRPYNRSGPRRYDADVVLRANVRTYRRPTAPGSPYDRAASATRYDRISHISPGGGGRHSVPAIAMPPRGPCIVPPKQNSRERKRPRPGSASYT
jgi:hypothetical protein